MIPPTTPDPVPGEQPRSSGSTTRPAGLCSGPGHVVVYGNAAFVSAFGGQSVGLPAREGMLGLPAEAFELLDVVGLDVSLAIERELYTEFREPGYAPAPLLEHLVTAGYLGRKSGRGFRTHA